jgi:hypothetical protein
VEAKTRHTSFPVIKQGPQSSSREREGYTFPLQVNGYGWLHGFGRDWLDQKCDFSRFWSVSLYFLPFLSVSLFSNAMLLSLSLSLILFYTEPHLLLNPFGSRKLKKIREKLSRSIPWIKASIPSLLAIYREPHTLSLHSNRKTICRTNNLRQSKNKRSTRERIRKEMPGKSVLTLVFNLSESVKSRTGW